MMRKRLRPNKGYKIYLFIEILFVIISLIFITSISMDIINKISLNKQVMELDNYILLSQEVKPEYKAYYKSTTIRDKITGSDYEVIFLSKEMLDFKEFKVTHGKSFDENTTINDILIGSNIDLNLNDDFEIQLFSSAIEGKVVGVLDDDEYLWKDIMRVPSNLNDTIVILDRDIPGYYIPIKYFIENSKYKESIDGEFITVKDAIIGELLKVDSALYISILFVVVLLLISISSINMIMSIVLEKRKKEFGIKYSLGSTKEDIFRNVANEFYILSFGALLISMIISIAIQGAIPKELGYTLNSYSVIGAMIIFVLITVGIIRKINKEIMSYSVSSLVKRR